MNDTATRTMTKTERIRAALAGAPVDLVPYSFWYHFRHEPVAGDGFVRATLNFLLEYDPDLLKVMHDSAYEMPTNKPVFENAADWANLPLNPPDSGTLGEQLRALRHIIGSIPEGSAPVVETVHSVYATAQRLSGGRLLEQLAHDPESVRHGLRSLAGALAGYASRAVDDCGCAGIFLNVTGAEADAMTAEQYAKVFLPLDQYVLGGAVNGWCNIVHLHGENLHLDMAMPLVSQAHALSYSDRTNPDLSLSAVRARTTKCLIGGVDYTRISGAEPDTIRAEIRDAIARTNRTGLIVAPGCTIPTETPSAHLHLFKETLS